MVVKPHIALVSSGFMPRVPVSKWVNSTLPPVPRCSRHSSFQLTPQLPQHQLQGPPIHPASPHKFQSKPHQLLTELVLLMTTLASLRNTDTETLFIYT